MVKSSRDSMDDSDVSCILGIWEMTKVTTNVALLHSYFVYNLVRIASSGLLYLELPTSGNPVVRTRQISGHLGLWKLTLDMLKQ